MHLAAQMQCGAKLYQKLNLHTDFCLQRPSKLLYWHRSRSIQQPEKNILGVSMYKFFLSVKFGTQFFY